MNLWIFGSFVNHKNESFLGFWVSWTEFRRWYAVFTFPEGSLIGSSDRRCLSCRVLMNQFKFFHPRNNFLNNLYDGFETFEINEGFQTLLTWNIPQADCLYDLKLFKFNNILSNSNFYPSSILTLELVYKTWWQYRFIKKRKINRTSPKETWPISTLNSQQWLASN